MTLLLCWQSILLLEDISLYITRPIDKTQAVCISRGTFSWDSIASRRSSTNVEKNDLRYVHVYCMET
jgi:hypothetical protein